MLLNRQEIENVDIIQESIPNNYKESSYNLRIGKIITHDGKIKDTIDLPPQGLVTVISEESLKVPTNHLLMATVKNGLSQKGVLALNIGLIDSGWQGPINSTIINFGKANFTLKKGDIFLRLTAHKYNSLPAEYEDPITSFPHDKYLNKTILDIRAYLGETFLSLDKTTDDIQKKVTTSIWEDVKRIGALLGYISIIGVIIGVLAFVIGRVSDITHINNKLIKMETQNELIINALKNTEKQSNNKLQLDSLRVDNKTKKHIKNGNKH